MNPCPTLPATGAATTSMVLVVVALIAFGSLLVVAVRWRRHGVVPAVIALVVGVTVLAGAEHSMAAAPCPVPTTTIAPTTSTSVPTTTSTTPTTSTTTTTTSSTTSSTTLAVEPQPPAASDDTATTTEDNAVSITVLDNDMDPDGDLLTVVSVTQPANGATVINASVTIIYTPNPNFNGTDSFTYTISDGNGGTDTATVTINVAPVNDPPTAADDTYAVAEDATSMVGASGVLGNDVDPDGDFLVAVLVVGPSNGTVTFNLDGSFTYTPNLNFNGTDSFTYTISDGNGGTDTATVTIDVVPVNDPPTAGDDAYGVSEDATLMVPASGVVGNDMDPDGDFLTVSLLVGPSNGTVTLNPDGSFAYTPTPNFNGTDSFTHTISDGNGGTDTATVTINVAPVNDPPTAIPDAYAMFEDETLIVPAPGVLTNDTDIDGDPLTAVLSVGPSNGTLAFSPDGSFTYTPNSNFNGTDSFIYTISDGIFTNTATVTINVAPSAP